MSSSSNTSIAKKARTKAEADFATWLMMAKLGGFDDLPSNAQSFLTNYRARLETISEAESTALAAPNLIARDFTAPAPNRVWLADITYIPTTEGWLYLAAVMDLFSRKIVGWAMRDHMQVELASAALTMAIQQQRPQAGLIHHSDRGVHYASRAYRDALKDAGIAASMSRKADCYDNAPMESFFHTLKTELVHHRDYKTRAEAQRDIFAFIEGFYNRTRLHSAIGYIAPIEMELKAA